MSDPIVKGVKRSPSRPASRHSETSSSKGRSLAGKSARPKPMAKRPATKKAPARKATKAGTTLAARTKASKKSVKKAVTRKPVRAKATPKSKAQTRKPVTAKQKKSAPAKSGTTRRIATRKTLIATPQPRQPSIDEAAALRAFERAHKEFARGHFGEARSLFRALLEKHSNVSEVAARARTYMAIAESRLRNESTLPRDADSLYDRGVIELNRGEYVAAQEMFERALKREPEAAHIHYSLAATRARLGAIDSALESLQRALDLQPTLRIRAQHDADLTTLRNDPDFERLVFASR
ncbi:MAG TPA: tetratricopeptide repeat protein [Pyrinomonadaceae bacterium]|nr:tetratricopeptide repeat protein [Pyrinomonadaceae bacterium]